MQMIRKAREFALQKFTLHRLISAAAWEREAAVVTGANIAINGGPHMY